MKLLKKVLFGIGYTVGVTLTVLAALIIFFLLFAVAVIKFLGST